MVARTNPRDELKTMILTAPSCRRLFPPSVALIRRAADQFRVQLIQGVPSRWAFERLLCGLFGEKRSK